MAHSNLKKKLQPANKAIKRLCKTVKSKLVNFNLSDTLNAIKNKTNRVLSYCSLHFFQLFKKRSLTRSKPSYFGHLHYNFYASKKQLIGNNFSPIYIDHLYSAEVENLPAKAETSRGKSISVDDRILQRKQGKGKEKEDDNKNNNDNDNTNSNNNVLYSIEDAWRKVVAKSPQLRPVDDRAEEFISKFRQDIKIQKQKSILEFEEMLARGS